MDLKRNGDKLVIAEADTMLILDVHVCGYLTRGAGKLASNPCPLSPAWKPSVEVVPWALSSEDKGLNELAL